ncbi:MAG: rod-binding protein [Rhodospirillales bacterium]|jgi:flagellar protein FlgJ
MSDNIMAMQAYEALAQKNPLPQAKPHAKMNMAQARKVAQDFEAVFISQMMKPMFEGTIAEAPFGGGSSEKIWRDMQLDEYGKAIAKSGGIGIADSIVREMIRMQEAQ